MTPEQRVLELARAYRDAYARWFSKPQGAPAEPGYYKEAEAAKEALLEAARELPELPEEGSEVIQTRITADFEEAVRQLRPYFGQLRSISQTGLVLIITRADGEELDLVLSGCFGYAWNNYKGARTPTFSKWALAQGLVEREFLLPLPMTLEEKEEDDRKKALEKRLALGQNLALKYKVPVDVVLAEQRHLELIEAIRSVGNAVGGIEDSVEAMRYSRDG